MSNLASERNDGPIETDLAAQYRDEGTIGDAETYVTDEDISEDMRDIAPDPEVDKILRDQS